MTRSPHRMKEHVKETVSELPIYAARLAVMGVGRALMLTDRVRRDYKEARESGLMPVLGRLKDDAESFTETVVGKVAGRPSSNGRSASEAPARPAADSEISVGKPKPAAATRHARSTTAAPKAATKPATKPTAKPATKPAAKPSPKPAPAPSPASKATTQRKIAQQKPAADKATRRTAKPGSSAKDLPVSGYDEATIASIRARLRGLDARQVAELRDYERTHSARAEFLRMYENRIAKLRGEA